MDAVTSVGKKIGPAGAGCFKAKNGSVVAYSTEKKEAEKTYTSAVKYIDKAVSKNLIHKNTGSRRKSQIARHLNSLK